MWSKALDLALTRFMRTGNLTLNLPDGQSLRLGDGTGDPVTANIHDAATVRRLVLFPELALGEAYMNGSLTIENDDIQGLLATVLANFDGADRVWWQKAHSHLRIALRRFMQNNVASLSRRNVAHHYDLSGKLYDLFLDADKQYSCAYFRHSDDTLDKAQYQKKLHIARKLQIKPGMRVLDIGCGWGGMALTLAREFGANVTGITLSQEQLAVAQSRASAENLDSKVSFHLTDYRDLTGTYDRIVSVGMFEHVGLPHFDTYFGTVRDRLAPDGVALIHTIGNTNAPGATNPWVAKYIFPGGYIPSLSEVAASVERQDLWITDVETLRLHYALTLRHWFDRFNAQADAVRKLYDDRFVRMWRFYLAASEQTFRQRHQAVFQVQITRNIAALPITRDYLFESASAESLSRAAE
jgi:cyclopropane-fatty-acyl-phospholipid synthase